MSKYRRHKRKDANHADIVKWFRDHGALVDDVSNLPGLGYDLIISVGDVVRVVEVKDGSKPPSARRLTESEVEAQARWGSQFVVVTSEADAEELLEAMEAVEER